jgi:hypothetical protein
MQRVQDGRLDWSREVVVDHRGSVCSMIWWRVRASAEVPGAAGIARTITGSWSEAVNPGFVQVAGGSGPISITSPSSIP